MNGSINILIIDGATCLACMSTLVETLHNSPNFQIFMKWKKVISRFRIKTVCNKRHVSQERAAMALNISKVKAINLNELSSFIQFQQDDRKETLPAVHQSRKARLLRYVKPSTKSSRIRRSQNFFRFCRRIERPRIRTVGNVTRQAQRPIQVPPAEHQSSTFDAC